MRKTLNSIAVFLSVITVISCEELSPVTPPSPEPETPKETPIIFSKSTVSEAYGLINGEVGLSIGNPVNVNNVKVVLDAQGNISCDTTLCWGLEQTTSSTFTAYYPYNASYSGKSEVGFSVWTDQAQGKNFETSRLLFASTKAKPSDNAVSLVFEDRMAGLDIWFDNRSGKTIKSVHVVSVLASTAFNLTSGYCRTLADTPVGINMYKPADGNEHYCAIIPPQRAKLGFNVEFTDGTSQFCSIENECDLEAKLYYTREKPIPLGEISEQTIGFTLSVRDWNYGGGIVFGKDTTPPCEFESALYLYSEVWQDGEEDDFSNILYYIQGEDIAHISVFITTSAEYLTLRETMSDEQIVKEYGYPYDNYIERLPEGVYFIRRNLSAGTEYTLVVTAENTEGGKETQVCTKSTASYPESDLVLGSYTLKGEGFTHTFNLLPEDGDNLFKITNLGDIDYIPFKAVYDKASSTLTLSGIAFGYESYGNLFGWGLYSYDESSDIRYISKLTESSTAIDDPLVFGIDKNGQISTLVSYEFGTEVYNTTDGTILGYYSRYFGAQTSIVYGDTSEKKVEPARFIHRQSGRSFPKVQLIR